MRSLSILRGEKFNVRPLSLMGRRNLGPEAQRITAATVGAYHESLVPESNRPGYVNQSLNTMYAPPR